MSKLNTKIGKICLENIKHILSTWAKLPCWLYGSLAHPHLPPVCCELHVHHATCPSSAVGHFSGPICPFYPHSKGTFCWSDYAVGLGRDLCLLAAPLHFGRWRAWRAAHLELKPCALCIYIYLFIYSVYIHKINIMHICIDLLTYAYIHTYIHPSIHTYIYT